MSKNRIFALGIIGFPDNERTLLRSMCLLTTERERGYLIVERKTDPPGEILLVNGDDPDAVAYINSTNDPKYPPNSPRLYIGAGAVATQPGNRKISRPITTTRLFEALDHITMDELDYQPSSQGNGKSKAISLPTDNARPTEQDSAGCYKALVVDNSRPARELLKIKLDALSLETYPAVTGEQALELIKHYRFDIIFMDTNLPAMDGYEVCRQIKSQDNYKTTPVCMLSDKASSVDKIKGKMAGCDEYLSKPIDSHDFFSIVNRLLKDKMSLKPVAGGS